MFLALNTCISFFTLARDEFMHEYLLWSPSFRITICCGFSINFRRTTWNWLRESRGTRSWRSWTQTPTKRKQFLISLASARTHLVRGALRTPAWKSNIYSETLLLCVSRKLFHCFKSNPLLALVQMFVCLCIFVFNQWTATRKRKQLRR